MAHRDQFIFCVVLMVCVLFSSQVAKADPEINIKSPLVSAETVQKLGCLTSDGRPLHSDCNLSSVTNLEKPFHTRGKWLFVVTQGPAEDSSDGAGIQYCFLDVRTAICESALVPNGVALNQKSKALQVPIGGSSWPYNEPGPVSIVYPVKQSLEPLLQFKPYEFNGGPGAPLGLLVFAYRKETDRFELIFSGTSHPNVNEETRLIKDGPLAGDIIADYQTARWPYRYKIMVYKLTDSEKYKKILDYMGNSKWDDGNTLAVIDAEMPEIERRLGIWKPGQALPLETTVDCKKLEYRSGMEWCD